ncbi:MAG: glycosyltransferase family 2 protein [Myxococcales bacterium]|nr:glycosyltransferase family 2 protein [Myxococcales bacterium]
MSAPLVSVLLPAYDAEVTLPAALASIERQTFRDFECVVVDDGSSDRTAEIVRAVAARDSRFVPTRIAHAGVALALTHGLARCRGRYVARMDADDLSHKRRLEVQVGWLEQRPELAGVGAHVWMFPRRTLTLGFAAHERWLNSLSDPDSVARDAFVESPIVHPTLCIRREVLSAHGYRDAGWPQDYDLVLRLLSAGARLAVVPQKLLGWRDGPGRVTRTADYTRRERLVACKAHYLAAGFLAQRSTYVLWGYGDTGRTLCRALAAHDKHPEAIVELHPRRIGQRIAGAPVIEPSALRLRPGVAVVISVSGLEARTEARARAAALGLGEGRDFVVAA